MCGISTKSRLFVDVTLAHHVRIAVTSIETRWEAQMKEDSGTIRTSSTRASWRAVFRIGNVRLKI